MLKTIIELFHKLQMYTIKLQTFYNQKAAIRFELQSMQKKGSLFFFSKKKGTTSLSLIRKVQRSFLDAQLLNVTLLLSLSCPGCQPIYAG